MKTVKIHLTHLDGRTSVREYDSNLEYLDLSYNQITQISGLENLPNLEYLDLSYNQITQISGLENLPNLKTLYLSYNQITQISGLENLPNLEYLYLSYNQITQISGLENLPNLKTLDLSYNQISQMDVISDNWCYIDRIYSRIRSKKKVNDLTVIKTTKSEYIIGKDGFYSHGKTLQAAKSDLNFKILSKNFNLDEVIKEIKKTNKVTDVQYRLITGACQTGIQMFKSEIGLKKNWMTLDEVKTLVSGRYGYEKFIELVG